MLNKGNSSSGGSGSSGGSPRYDQEGNVLGPSEKQSYTYDGTNPPNHNGNINVSSWNSAIGTQQANNIYYLDNNGIMVTGQYTINGKVCNFDTAVGATEGKFLY